jgi:hypothetical protein
VLCPSHRAADNRNEEAERSQMALPQVNSRGNALPIIVLAACATAVMPVVALVKPAYVYPCMFFFLIGLVGTWRQYVRWRRSEREQAR